MSKPLAAAVITFLTIANSTAVAQQMVNAYVMNLKGDIAMSIMGQKQHVISETNLGYRNDRVGQKTSVTLTNVDLDVKMNDQPAMDISMDASGFNDRIAGTSATVEEANEELKAILVDGFGAPLCEIVLDKYGQETSRKIVAKPGAADLIANGQVENARLFHPPFFPDKKSWEAPAKVSIGNGNFAEGKFTYTVKSTDPKTGFVSVDVKGLLLAKGKQGPLDLTDGLYDMKGNQIYDPKQNIWRSGKLDADVSFSLEQSGRKIARAEGKMTIGLASKDK